MSNRSNAAPRTDIPTVDDNSVAYWQGARECRLMIARCAGCGRVHHYPRPRCPYCWSDDVQPTEASGAATLYTYSTVYVNDLPPFETRVPYIAALVDLAEGPRLMTNIVGCAPHLLRIGMRLQVDFVPLDDQLTMPVFTPVHDDEEPRTS